VNITDAVVMLRYLFAGAPQPRLRLADTDLDRRIIVADAIGVLVSVFGPAASP
jgi:hypothetical protein